jgi:hypothetical protein
MITDTFSFPAQHFLRAKCNIKAQPDFFWDRHLISSSLSCVKHGLLAAQRLLAGFQLSWRFYFDGKDSIAKLADGCGGCVSEKHTRRFPLDCTGRLPLFLELQLFDVAADLGGGRQVNTE